jgi:hypothetical protein
MRERVIGYFKDNAWWIFTFLFMVIADTALTLFILANHYGIEANPLIGDKLFDWSFHFWRIDIVLLLIPLIALMPLSFKFVRNWLLQGITVGYGWSVVNGLTIALFKVDIGIYQYIPQPLYFVGIVLQFTVGFVILWLYRRLGRGNRIVDIH